jgi:hypothetical protein
LKRFLKVVIHKHLNTKAVNIIHTKLRHNCLLNYDLHRRNIIDSHDCDCGMKEDTYHFFFVRKRYSLRNVMFDELFKLQELSIIDTRTSLWGDDNLGLNITCKMFYTVQKFISNSERFSLL